MSHDFRSVEDREKRHPLTRFLKGRWNVSSRMVRTELYFGLWTSEIITLKSPKRRSPPTPARSAANLQSSRFAGFAGRRRRTYQEGRTTTIEPSLQKHVTI